MQLIPREIDKLLISQVGALAQRRLARGVKLNQSEATALLAHVIQELIRDGNHTVAQLMSAGREILGRRHVLPAVPSSLSQIQIEGTFPTGTHLVTVDQPICTEDGNIAKALYGSFLPLPSMQQFPLLAESEYHESKMPGAIVPSSHGRITLNGARQRVKIGVTNKGDRPIQIGSHYHFIEANPELEFDRIRSYGYHLDIAAGTSTRFEPGDNKTVTLVAIGGNEVIRGGSSIAPGHVDAHRTEAILQTLNIKGFNHTTATTLIEKNNSIEPFTMDRQRYATMYGPTTGDLVRLGATDLWIKIEKDYVVYGDECTFGGGKTLRDGIGQASGYKDDLCLDLVITNVIILDWTGIYKADIGIKGGFIVAIGKAGNPDTMDGVTPLMVIGSNTDVIAGEGKIVTAGGIDTHVHYTSPQQVDDALASGITTVVGGGTGPSTGSVAANCTPSKTYISQMMQACDKLPINFAIIGKGSDSDPAGLREQCEAGVAALKLHEDWGCTPAAIDNCLAVCEEYDIQCELHSDTLNESGFVDQTEAAFKDRTIHAYHIEGAGGGHAPDIISLVQNPKVLPSSTSPTMPYTSNTIDEHLDMVMACHHLSKEIPEDISFADSRIRDETIAAEDILHDIGAISMMSSDSHAMGRCGEVIIRTWNTAHKNKVERGTLKNDENTDADNYRVKMYVSKYTINPAITQGMSHIIGSIEVGKLADLVIWDPANFGCKPSLVLKSGFVAASQMGDPNAAITTVQPIIMRPMYSQLVPQASVLFVSQASLKNGAIASYKLRKRIEVVRNCRSIGKKDMKYNNAMPEMKVDPELFSVTANGLECKARPASSLPLAQQYFIY